MARTPSSMIPLGTHAPAFALPDTVSGQRVDSSSLDGRPSVVIFICNHCPFVQHIRAGLADFGRWCGERQVPMVAISSNDVASFPQDGPAEMAREARQAGFVFPYLYDEAQSVARAYDARCTPDLFVFDAEGKLAYRGQFDASRPGNGVPVTGSDARAAVQALLAGQRPTADQRPSIGCNIKWKPGNEPPVSLPTGPQK